MRRLALAAALGLALAGCGGSGSGTASPGSASPTTSPPATASPTTSAPATSSAPPASTAPVPRCPLEATEVPPPQGAVRDLDQKPTVRGSSAPPPTTVQVADLVEGKGDQAQTLDEVEVKYVGALYESGKEFDSSWTRSPDQTLPFTVCGQGVIPGFAIAPTGMKVGGRRQVTIPARYGYGEQGSPPTIPANATLVFVIDLMEVTRGG